MFDLFVIALLQFATLNGDATIGSSGWGNDATSTPTTIGSSGWGND